MLNRSEQIRQDFLDFFAEKQHEVVPSASLVPHDDPTLLFTNAGMNQFKDVFLGTGSRAYQRAADTQKCLRVSGKHNDLEEVGIDTYHHTFFEMLGNWSFGDYFKRDAIRWAWELLVDRWGLEPDRLYATVHEGDTALGLAADQEAADLWAQETSINPDHILFCPSKDNFWMMGDTGPCGPCSEIHIDLRSDEERARTPGHTLVNAEDPQVMEIWNLVFIQYNAQPDGSLEPLAARHVDTGMGFERIVAVLQGKKSNYDTDLFAPILQAIAVLSPIKALRSYEDVGADVEAERERLRIAMRVVADHIRTIAFAVADGVMPGNVGRNYVIRRILRRAVRYGYQTLGFREPFLHRLVEPLKKKMGPSFPELERQQDFVERVVRAEEENFLETLGTGLAFFDRIAPYVQALAADEAEDRRPEILRQLREDRSTLDLLAKAYVDEDDTMEIVRSFADTATEGAIPGEVAFLLHDTYGFPIDLTQLMAREHLLRVEMAAYEDLMLRQKTRARAATSFKADASGQAAWTVVRAQDDPTLFVGYDQLIARDASVVATRTVDLDGTPRHELILDQTPFYAESGGQVGDTGTLRVGEAELQVLDTQVQSGRVVHVVDRLPEALDAPVEAHVDAERRRRIMKHHTATHLLHAALREVLGAHVAQKGSLVAPDRLRFDVSHYEAITPGQLRTVEQRVNAVIQQNIAKQEERAVPVEEALARGAMALFGEKYGDHVRVITFDADYSVELCGGTHVEATGEIGLFSVLSEGSVASGVRRLEAVVGLAALDRLHAELDELARARAQFRTLGRPVDEEIADLLEQRKQLEKELLAAQQGQLEGHLDAFVEQAQTVDGIRLVTGRLDGADMDQLRDLGQTLRDRLGDGAVAVLGGADDEAGKVFLVATVADDLLGSTKLKAGALVGALGRRVGGGGGGRPALATAGGKQPEHLEATLEAVAEVVASLK
ncbi:MAG: alanine--tRNA ligase [Bacteroidota bacterium]